MRHVLLVGLMGSGTSTVGALLAARLQRPYVDNDAVLERSTGRPARRLRVELERQAAARRPPFGRLADLTVDATAPPGELVDALVERLQDLLG